MTPTVRVLPLAIGVLMSVTGCSGDGEDDDAAEILPCSKVWVVGEKLPSDYEGCERSGEVVKPRLQKCTEIKGQMAFHDERFYAVLGEDIKEVPGDQDPSESSQSSYFFSC